MQSRKNNGPAARAPQTPRGRTRREFLVDTALAAAATTLGSCFPDVGGEWPHESEMCNANPTPTPPDSVAVVEVWDEASVVEHAELGTVELFPDVIASMLQDALAQLAGSSTPWPVLLPDCSADTRIGLKVNCLNKQCATSVPLVRALIQSLKQGLGTPAENIIVWDRSQSELSACGFNAESVGAQVVGTLSSGSADLAPGYEKNYCPVEGKTTRLSRILTELTDITINVPVLKTHDVSGVTAAMKNVYGVIDNPGDFHDDLNTALPRIYALTPICASMRLVVVDALVAVTMGSTSDPSDTFPRRLLAAKDPVALDSYALVLANQLRAENNERMQAENPDDFTPLPPIDPATTLWIQNSEALGLGTRAYALATSKR